MSIEEIRRKAQRFLSKRRRDNAIGLAFSIIVIVFCMIAVLSATLLVARIVAGFVMIVMTVRLINTIYFSYRRYGTVWPAIRIGPEVALTTCLDFYRNELERQREFARQPTWQLAVTLFITGWLTRDALLNTSRDLFRVALPFVLLAAALLIVLLAVRKFEARRVESELAALDKFQEKL